MIRNSQNQVCNIELAEKLCNLGVEQNSIFWWRKYQFCKNSDLYYIPNKETDLVILSGKLEKNFSAFTSSELLENLPWELYIGADRYELDIYKYGNGYGCFYYNLNDEAPGEKLGNRYFENESFSNVLSELLIYLIENGLYEKKN